MKFYVKRFIEPNRMLKINMTWWYFAICKYKAAKYEACFLWCTYMLKPRQNILHAKYDIYFGCKEFYDMIQQYGRIKESKYFYIQMHRSNIRTIVYFCLRLNSWEEIFSNDECLQKTNLKCSQVLRRLQKQ